MWAFSRNQQVQAGDSFRQELEEKRCSDSLPPRDRRQGPHRGAGERGGRVGEIVCLVLLASPCCFSHFLLLLLENKQLLGAEREAVGEEVGGRACSPGTARQLARPAQADPLPRMLGAEAGARKKERLKVCLAWCQHTHTATTSSSPEG